MKKRIKRIWSLLLVLTILLTQVFSGMGSVQADNTTNLALGRTIASNNYTDVYVPTNGNDGNIATYWEGRQENYPNTLTVDLGTDKEFHTVVLKLNPSWEQRTQTFSIRTSSDNVNYSTQVTSNSYTFSPANNNIVTINFDEITARYVRLEFTSNTGATGGQVAEFEVYGTTESGYVDLVVTDIVMNPSNPSSGEEVTFSAIIKNQGTAPTPGGVVTGVSFLVNDVQVSWADHYNTSIKAGESITVTANGGPNGNSKWIAASGSHVITAWVDDVNRIHESNESNNQLMKTVLVDGNLELPDFVITDIAYSPSNPAPGNEVTFSAIVRNQGQRASSPGTVGFYINGALVAESSDMSSIGAMDTRTITASSTWMAAAGTHSLSAHVDRDNLIIELNENNNIFTKEIVVGTSTGGSPDLIVSEILSSPVSPLTGEPVLFSAVVKNQGTGATPYTTIGVSFFVNDTQVSWSDNTIRSLLPGESITVTANGGPSGSNNWTATTGNHTVRAWVDDVNRIQESNETNNQLTKTLAVTTAPMPDFVVTNLTYAPSNPISGENVTLTATIKNQGTKAGAPGVLAFLVDGVVVSESENQTTLLSAGSTMNISGSFIASSVGEVAIVASVDSKNTTEEGNEANNTYGITIPISPKPGVDLVVTDINWTPNYVTQGSGVIFSAVVKNQGTVPSPAGIVSFKINETEVAVSSNHTASIQPGSTVTISANSPWNAESGTHNVSATVDKSNIISETDEFNNSFGTMITIGSGGRGATMPYTRYESEEGIYGGGAILRSAPTFDYALTASEASNQQYVALPVNGSYVEWNIHQGGAGVNMRFTMPDSSDGMGLSGSLDCYVNGVKVETINLSSYWSWQYFIGDHPDDAPNGGQPAFRFDEVHWKLNTPLKSGDTLRIQKTNGDGIEYGVDFVEVEPVPDPIQRPANSLSVTEFGAIPNDDGDDLAAFVACVNAAAASNKSVYIPAGNYHLSDMWVIRAHNITITGAGMWHTNIMFTSPNAASGGISLRITGTIDFSNVYLNSMLRSRHGQMAIYKCFMDNFGTNSKIHNFWQEHFECGFWVGDYANTPAIAADNLLIENGRIRNNLADGVNFCQGTKNSTVRNCNVRNNGDDGLAIWPDQTMGAPMAVNNSFMYNTIENNWRAAAIAIFGGSGHKAQFNYIKDCFMGSGIRLNTVFPGYHFQNNTGIIFSDTTIINSGTSQDCYDGERGAIDLEASRTSISNILFENIDIINSQRDAIQIGYSGGFDNIVFRNINIDGTGLDGKTRSRFSAPHIGGAVYTYTNNGEVRFINLRTSNIALPEIHQIMEGFKVTFE